MIPSAARAFERLFGAALQPLAGGLRLLAFAALGILLVVSIGRVARAIAARRFGWEPGTVVRCPVCARPAADAALSTCPEGHPLRFPPGAAGREIRRRSGRGRRRHFLLASAAAGLLGVAAALAGARAFRITDAAAPPLAGIAGAAGFLFFATALAAAGRAASPDARGPLDRALSAVAGTLVLVPALFFLLFSRAADPPVPRTIGSLWQTPSALYVSPGGRARREAEAAPSGTLEAEVVGVRSGLLGLSWEGLARLRAGGTEIPWRGSGGTAARLLNRLPRALARPGSFVAVTRDRRPVAAPANVKVWILRSPAGIAFTTAAEAETAAPDVPRSGAR